VGLYYLLIIYSSIVFVLIVSIPVAPLEMAKHPEFKIIKKKMHKRPKKVRTLVERATNFYYQLGLYQLKEPHQAINALQKLSLWIGDGLLFVFVLVLTSRCGSLHCVSRRELMPGGPHRYTSFMRWTLVVKGGSCQRRRVGSLMTLPSTARSPLML